MTSNTMARLRWSGSVLTLLVCLLALSMPYVAQALTLSNGAVAMLVLGQNDFVSSISGGSSTKMNAPRGIVVDPVNDKVYIADTGNSRVLRFASRASLSNGAPAEAVLGQPDFTSTAGAVGQNRLDNPIGLALDSSGGLWVADNANHRVLRFDNAATKASGANADFVLGQPDFTTKNPATSQNGMRFPMGVFAEGTRLWVADTDNSRVLRFDNIGSKTNGANADVVLGQPSFSQNGLASSASGMQYPRTMVVDSAARLWVVDTYNHRVLRFDNAAGLANGASATALLGGATFGAISPSCNVSDLRAPHGLAIDNSSGRLWVAQAEFRRISWFDSAAGKANGAAADGVLGQANFTNCAAPSSASNANLNEPNQLFYDAATDTLWATDPLQNRVVRFGGSVAATPTPTPTATPTPTNTPTPTSTPTPTPTSTPTPTPTATPTPTPTPTSTPTPTPIPNEFTVGNVLVQGSFAPSGGLIVSSGSVGLGAPGGPALYRVASAQWSGSGPIQASNLSFAGGALLISGPVSIDRVTGAVTPQTGSQVQITRLGANLPINASLAIDVRQPGIAVSGVVSLDLPGNSGASVSVGYMLGPDGAVASTSPGALSLAFLGGALSGQASATQAGLLVATPALSLSGLAPIGLPALLIDGTGPNGMRLNGAGGMPDIQLGSDALVLHSLSATLPSFDRLDLSGSLRLAHAPGGQAPSVPVRGLRIAGGAISGSPDTIWAEIGGRPLALGGAAIEQSGGFYRVRAASASLLGPDGWRPAQLELGAATLAASMPFFQLDSGNVALPQLKLGGTDVLQLRGLVASLQPAGGDSYSLDATGEVELWGLADGQLRPGPAREASAPLSLTISGGRATGTAAGTLRFSVSQVNFEASALTLSDDLLRASAAQLEIGFDGNSTQAPIYGLELGGRDGFAFQSGRVLLPDFRVGQVKLRNITLERRLAVKGALVFGGTARFAFGRFVVDGQYHLGSASNSDALMRVSVGWERLLPGDSIPLGAGTIGVTRVAGQFDLYANTTDVTLTMEAVGRADGQSEPLIQINGPVQILLSAAQPFQQPAAATASLLGKRISDARVRLDDRRLTVRGTLALGGQRAPLDLSFGSEEANATTLVGTLSVDVTLPKGYLFNDDVAGQGVQLPSQDELSRSVPLIVGRFQDKGRTVWAARGLLLALNAYDVQVSVDLSASPLQIQLSNNLEEITTVGSQNAPSRLTTPAPNENNGGGRKRRKGVKGVVKGGGLLAASGQAGAAPAGAVPTVTDEDDQIWPMELAYTDVRQGVKVYTLDVERDVEIDVVKQKWTFQPPDGATMAVQVEESPALGQLEICAKGQCASSQGGQLPTLTPADQLSFSWEASTPKPGMALTLYAQDRNGRLTRIDTRRTDGLLLKGDNTWNPALPNGTYTVTAVLAADLYAPFEVEVGRIEVFKPLSVRPAPLASVSLSAQRDRSVVLVWDTSTVEPDVAGYRISVNEQEFDIPADQTASAPILPFGLSGWSGPATQQLRSYMVYGLAAGQPATIEVAPYDMNGSAGDAVGETVQVPAFALAAIWPQPGTMGLVVDNVGVSLTKLGTLTITLRDQSGVLVAGLPKLIEPQEAKGVGRGVAFWPARSLPPGRYRVEISAAELDGSDSFTAGWDVAVAARLYFPVMRR